MLQVVSKLNHPLKKYIVAKKNMLKKESDSYIECFLTSIREYMLDSKTVDINELTNKVYE